MSVKKTVAIIGATSQSGTILANLLSTRPFRLLLISRDEKAVNDLVEDLLELHPSANIEAMNCSVDGCWEADIVVMAIPREEEEKVASAIQPVITGKTIIAIGDKLQEPVLAHGEDDGICDGNDIGHLFPYTRFIRLSAASNEDELLEMLLPLLYQY